MLFRVVAVLLCLSSACAEFQEPQPVTIAMHRAPKKRTLRVIGTEQDMVRGGEQYCRGAYTLEYTSWDKTEALITCQ